MTKPITGHRNDCNCGPCREVDALLVESARKDAVIDALKLYVAAKHEGWEGWDEWVDVLEAFKVVTNEGGHTP